jgi:hypothetical protein
VMASSCTQGARSAHGGHVQTRAIHYFQEPANRQPECLVLHSARASARADNVSLELHIRFARPRARG